MNRDRDWLHTKFLILVVIKYINRISVVQKLYDYAVRDEDSADDNLSVACYQCLAVILESQTKFIVLVSTFIEFLVSEF